MNGKRVQEIADQIEANPSCWYQKAWHCHTSHCFGGLAQINSGKPANDSTVRTDAREWLGLTMAEADYLFHSERTLKEIKEFALGAYYDRDGYNRDSYNRDGYNRDGYDRDGFDRHGFDRYGLNRDGYHRAGYDPDGYDRAGFDRQGFDRAGYDRDGLDRNNKRKP